MGYGKSNSRRSNGAENMSCIVCNKQYKGSDDNMGYHKGYGLYYWHTDCERKLDDALVMLDMLLEAKRED